ncbi:hypothetical protein DERP_004601, partial [Dermatophagoides pteronyssinus]
ISLTSVSQSVTSLYFSHHQHFDLIFFSSCFVFVEKHFHS